MRKMRRTRTALALSLTFACLLAALPGAGARGTDAAPQQMAEWTVMVFMDGDNNLEEFAIKDFAEMARVADSPRLNVVVQLDRIPRELNPRNDSTAHGDWKHTLRFKVKNGMTPTVANALSPQESELAAGQETNMGHPDTLASFVTWAMRKYPARHYLLDIWDHGDGWRRLHTVSPQMNSAAARAVRREDAVAAEAVRTARGGQSRSLATLVSEDETLDSPHRAISMDDTDRDRLYMREVQDSLAGALGGWRLNIIGFDACLMAMVENGFAMRNVADVMVGSEELEPGNGWRYNDWLSPLLSSPTPMEPVALAREMVRSYKRTYENVDPETTLSAIDLSEGRIAALAQVVSDLGDELRASLNGPELANIKAARDSCTPYAPGRGYFGIDLHRFCEQLIARTAKPALRDRAQAVLQILNNNAFVLENYAGSDRQGTFGSRGLAIYFPESKAAYLSDPYHDAYSDANGTYPVEFVQQHQWDNFLQEYFEKVP